MNREETLQAAERAVNGSRDGIYGTPEDNFGLIARLWTEYKSVLFSPVDVAVMMILLKSARICTGCGTADSFVDIAGYAACGNELLEGENGTE